MYTPQGILDRSTAIERYGPMVRRAAAQLASKLPANVELDDLVQAGMIGLIDAVSRYEVSHGVQFETFAMQRVRGAMLDELRGGDWMPRSVRRTQRSIEAAIRKAEHDLGRAPSEAEIARSMGVAVGAYQQMLGEARGAQLVYIDDLGGGDDDDENYIERTLASGDQTPHERLNDQRFRAALVEAIGQLPERDQLVMSLYYEQGLNLKEVGAVLGVTESRVSQLHSQAVARLRASMRDWT